MRRLPLPLTVATVAAVLAVLGCTAAPSGPGNPSQNSGDFDVWCFGDSISWPTCQRLDGVYVGGIGGTGWYKTPTVPTQYAMTEAAFPDDQPTTVLVITGGNDWASGYTLQQLSSQAQAFHDNLEADGIDVRYITEPLPDNGNLVWAGYQQYNDWLVATYPDTIDCAWAGHPTETWGNYPVHPTAAGYDSYAACIAGHLTDGTTP